MSEPIDLPPVRERLSAPETYRPQHPLVVEWRALTPADTDLAWHLQQAIDGADHPNWLTTREEIEELFGFSHVDLERDTIVALDAAGRAIALAAVVMPPLQITLVRSFVEGGVHPDVRGRGIGRELLAWSQTRALQQLANSDKRLPAWALAYADERAPQNVRLFERFGFTVARYFVALERDLRAPIPFVEPTADVRIVPYSSDRSDATHAALTDSFRDHWASQPMNDEQWDSWIGGSTFRPDISFLAIAQGERGVEVAGFVLCQVTEEDWASQGFTGAYIGLVGTRRAWRGRRIAPALLSAALRASADHGWDKVTLDVDSENPSGALGLYVRMGFERTTSQLALTREF